LLPKILHAVLPVNVTAPSGNIRETILRKNTEYSANEAVTRYFIGLFSTSFVGQAERSCHGSKHTAPNQIFLKFPLFFVIAKPVADSQRFGGI